MTYHTVVLLVVFYGFDLDVEKGSYFEDLVVSYIIAFLSWTTMDLLLQYC